MSMRLSAASVGSRRCCVIRCESADPNTVMGYRHKPEGLRAFCDQAMVPFVSTSELPALANAAVDT